MLAMYFIICLFIMVYLTTLINLSDCISPNVSG